MKQALKRKWIAALRSGKYKQGREYLLRNHQYCCLGVLCSIRAPGEWRLTMAAKDADELSKKGLADVGIAPSDQATLVQMNDTEHKSFAEIADWIKANL